MSITPKNGTNLVATMFDLLALVDPRQCRCRSSQ
jgi:hypothetical protein